MSEHAVITCGRSGEIRDASLGAQAVVEAFKKNTATRFVLTFLPRDQLKAAMLKGGGMAEQIGVENDQQVEELFEKGHTEIKGQPVTLEWCSCNDTRSHKQSGVTLNIM